MSVINTNVKSLVARDAMTINNRSLSTAMERLSTGKRINSAADDAAGLSIGTRMDAQVKGLNMAIKNANDTISVTQTAEGAMQEVTSILQRMRELAVQSSSDTNSAEDRAFLQQEVGQLSTEIDRISSTTQFNGMNVLDGSWANKTFQIGANQGQTMKFSIGSMKSNMLGVSSSVVGAPTAVSAPSIGDVTGATAKGTSAGPTTIKLGFSSNDTYAFDLKDATSGLTGVVTGAVLDLTSSISKADFATKVNKALKESAIDTKVTGSVTALGDTTNITTTPEAVKFSISVGGGAVKNIDLKARLIGDGGSATAVTALRIQTALQAELRAQYDDSITVTGTNATAFAVTDAQGRSIDLSQGLGNGAIFGTDTANTGALSTTGNTQNNLSVAWSATGNDLLLTNKAGGETSILNYAPSTGTSSVVFDASGSVPGQVQNPVTLVKTASAFSDPKVTANGKVEETKIGITFSERSDTADTYTFKLTDGAGHAYASLTALDLGKDISAATIVSTVKTALTTALTNAAWKDKSITADDFDVAFSGNTLTVTNKEGLSLAVEDFSSTAGYATVTPMNELGKATVVASQNAYTSEVRMGLNTTSIGQVLTAATDAGKFDIYVDGIKSAAKSVDVTASFTAGWTGAAIATKLQTDIRAANDIKIGGAAAGVQDMSNVTVSYDADHAQFVIRDPAGRSISLRSVATNDLKGTGTVWLQDSVTGISNNVAQVNVDSNVAKGGLYEVTKMDVTLSQDKVTDLSFKLNGVALTATAWDSTQPFQGSAAQTNLNALVASINTSHPNNSVEYTVDGNKITFLQRDGGALEFSDFATAAASSAVYATATPGTGQGSSKVVNYNEVLTTAKATGGAPVATNAKLHFNSPDLVSMSISDGSKTYTLGATAVDVTDRSSTSNFVKALNKSLATSNITASMDLTGNLYLSDSLGGNVSITSFNTASGQGATWQPDAGQGDAMTLSSGFVGSAPASGAAAGVNGLAVGAGSTSVSQISIATQDGASKAIVTLDKALSYVNAERSKLGAIENRLTHTVDNLTNIVTNTSASKSRIVDTDYATETTELARAQIISQAATAMLAQANQSAQGVLSLLK